MCHTMSYISPTIPIQDMPNLEPLQEAMLSGLWLMVCYCHPSFALFPLLTLLPRRRYTLI
ncbi:hypothetical protein AN958_01377 [Leucoagaricus sp. SymC.cos]|nr:hypothetical protein AN958_01377 [Leucoagaricus sp. SymC.cos]